MSINSFKFITPQTATTAFTVKSPTGDPSAKDAIEAHAGAALEAVAQMQALGATVDLTFPVFTDEEAIVVAHVALIDPQGTNIVDVVKEAFDETFIAASAIDDDPGLEVHVRTQIDTGDVTNQGQVGSG